MTAAPALVEKVRDAAARLRGPGAAPSGTRILAGLGLVALGVSRPDAASACDVPHTNQFSPSQWARVGLTPEMVERLRTELGVVLESPAPRPPQQAKTKTKAAPPIKALKPRKERNAPTRKGISRFGHAEIDVERAHGLAPDHPALSEGRTIFPSMVVGTADSPRFLVSGMNNPKLGKAVVKGERAGWPIYHLTLEERATCPRSCAQWSTCYGNATPYARRHRPDDAFLPNLSAEISQLQRQHPKGFLVRLHTLGDFYAPEYVLFWAEMLAAFPALHVFGYTARRVDDPDPLSARIARTIAVMTHAMWGRFAIRTSHVEAGPERAIVVTAAPADPEVVVCPAQLEKTAACSTCGLCWAEGARSKTIAFLTHGMKRGRRKARAEDHVPDVGNMVAPAPIQTSDEIGHLAAPQVSAEIGQLSDLPAQVDGYSAQQTAAMAQVLEALGQNAGPDGRVTISFSALSGYSGVPQGSLGFLTRALADRAPVKIERGVDRAPNTYILPGAHNPAHISPPISETPASAPESKAPSPESAAVVPFKVRELQSPFPSRPYNPVSPRKLRYARWFLAANWRLPDVADLFDVEPADLREAIGAAA